RRTQGSCRGRRMWRAWPRGWPIEQRRDGPPRHGRPPGRPKGPPEDKLRPAMTGWASAAPADLNWWRPAATPVDRDGPTMVPFEPLGWDVLDRPVFAQVTAIADRQPEAVALRDGARALTYDELCRRVRGLALRIIEAAPRDAAVAVLVPDGLDAAVAMLACFAAARVCLMISTGLPPRRVAAIIEAGAAAAVLLAPGGAAAALPRLVRPII